MSLNQSLLIQISPDDLQTLIIDCLQAVLGKPGSPESKEAGVPTRRYVYGLAGLAKLLNCSHPTAQRIKDSGQIKYSQIGRKLIFDEDEVLKAMSKTSKTHRYAR